MRSESLKEHLSRLVQAGLVKKEVAEKAASQLRELTEADLDQVGGGWGRIRA
jgi:DNA-binding HxlR family transcriptional regulator